MVFCLLQESPQICFSEREEIDKNELDVAHRGRDPDLKLSRDASECSLKEWGLEICDMMLGICELLDKSYEDQPYIDALNEQIEKIKNPDLTPSAKMLEEMRSNGEGFYHFARRMSKQHHEYFNKVDLDREQCDFFKREAEESLKKQKAIEEQETISFDEYLKDYFSQS